MFVGIYLGVVSVRVCLYSLMSVCEAVSGYVPAHGDVLCGCVFVSVYLSVRLASGFLM